LQYTQDAIKVMAEKMAIIEEEQKAQMELIKTHIIKEANINNETKEKFIENKIEEAAAIAEEKAQGDAVIMANE
jgi:predicted transcriptional regulator